MGDYLHDHCSHFLGEEFNDIVPWNGYNQSDCIVGNGNVLLNGCTEGALPFAADDQNLSDNRNNTFDANEAFDGLLSNDSFDGIPIVSDYMAVVSTDENDSQINGSNNKTIETTDQMTQSSNHLSAVSVSIVSNNSIASDADLPSTSTQSRSRSMTKSCRRRGRPSKNRSLEEKKAATRQTNKKSAKGYRERNKKTRIDSQQKINDLTATKEGLLKTIGELESAKRTCRQLLRQHSNLTDDTIDQLLAKMSNPNTIVVICPKND